MPDPNDSRNAIARKDDDRPSPDAEQATDGLQDDVPNFAGDDEVTSAGGESALTGDAWDAQRRDSGRLGDSWIGRSNGAGPSDPDRKPDRKPGRKPDGPTA